MTDDEVRFDCPICDRHLNEFNEDLDELGNYVCPRCEWCGPQPRATSNA